jgi:outer membrane protein TolC
MKHWYKLSTFSLIALMLGGSISGHAQAITLTIEDLFQQVEQANTEVQLAHKDVAISTMRRQAERDSRLPDINVALEGNYLGNVYVLDRDFGNATRSPMTHWGNSFGITAHQPLYTGGEITAKMRRAEAQTVIAENNVTLVEDQMKMLILQCYLELFKNRNLLSVYDENIRLTSELVDEMRARVKQGLALANDVTRYDLNLSNLSYDRLTVINTIKNLNYSLVSYLRISDCEEIIPTIDFDRINFSAAPLSEWMSLSHQESPTLRKFDLQKAETTANEKLIKSETLPKIGLNAGTSVVAPITTHTPVLDKNISKWYVGLSVSFTPSAFYKSNHKLQAARLETERLQDAKRAQEEIIDRNIDRAYKSYIEAVEHVTTQKKNVELASENYRIVERRYNNDLSLLTDMLDASTSKIDAEMRLVNAQVDVLYYYFQLKYLSGII